MPFIDRALHSVGVILFWSRPLPLPPSAPSSSSSLSFLLSPAAWSLEPGAGEEMRSPCSFKFNVTVSERADDESPIIGSVYLPLNVSL